MTIHVPVLELKGGEIVSNLELRVIDIAHYPNWPYVIISFRDGYTLTFPSDRRLEVREDEKTKMFRST